MEILESKALNGRRIKHVRKDHISEKLSDQFLQSGQLFPETESFTLAIRDMIITTENYQKFIIKDGSVKDENYRKCRQFSEIKHITAGCKLIAGTEYTNRHNSQSVAKIIRQRIALDRKLHPYSAPYYNYSPKTILENSNFELY